METIKKAIQGTKEKLAIVRSKLLKRRLRVQYCKSTQALWKKRLEKAVQNGWQEKADRAERKLTYWHEQLDKAILGRKGMEKREARLEKKLAFLKKEKDELAPTVAGIVTPTRGWNSENRSGPSWMVPLLDQVYNSGVHFTAVSWYRTKEYSQSLCYGICGAPSCSGTCAGLASNHACPPTYTGTPYEGAIDVTNYYEVKSRLIRLGITKLRNDLPSDPVHFSYTGR